MMQIRFRRVAAALTFVSTILPARGARAQVTDAERASARELFKQGDALQREGKFADALDKFQRAQQVFAAPTNVLRMAECDAALGRLVESTEAYREVLRTQLPPNAPPVFQAAIDQAKAELSQVEPRVPKLVVQVQPAGVQVPQMTIDGQSVPGALVGEPIPLDPGPHKINLIAPGYASSEQQVELKEHENKTVAVALKAIPGVNASSTAAVPPVYYQASGQEGVTVGAPPPPPPPPPPLGAPPEAPTAPEPKRSNLGLLFGVRLGADGAVGTVPNPNLGTTTIASGGWDIGGDAGFRFGRHWVVGLTLDHAVLNGADHSDANTTYTTTVNTTSFAGSISFISNPDRVAFFGQLGIGARWYNITNRSSTPDGSGGTTEIRNNKVYSGAEFNGALGVWIAIGHAVRLLPEVTLSIASVSGGAVASASGAADPSSTDSTGTAAIATLSLAGFYNLNF